MSETSGLSTDLSPERREPSIVQRIVNAWDCCGTCAGGVLAAHVREERAKALREAADELDRFAHETYGEDIFHRPSSDDYAQINALLKRERGHQLDGIAADVMSRAIEVQAARLRDRADRIARQEGDRE